MYAQIPPVFYRISFLLGPLLRRRYDTQISWVAASGFGLTQSSSIQCSSPPIDSKLLENTKKCNFDSTLVRGLGLAWAYEYCRRHKHLLSPSMTHLCIFVAKGFDLRAPAVNIVETLFIGYVIEKDESGRTSIVSGCYGSIPFLTCGVPNLQVH